MSVAKHLELQKELIAAGPHNARELRPTITSALAHWDSGVRFEAVNAVIRTGMPGSLLQARLAVERNAIVLTELCEGLVATGRKASLGALRNLASGHPSGLVRSYALLAVFDLGGDRSLGFLRARYDAERSDRVRAALSCLFAVAGADGAAERVTQNLRSRRWQVRSVVVMLLTHYRPRRGRALIREALATAMQAETKKGLQADMKTALRLLR